MNVVYAEYEKSLFARLHSLLSDTVPIAELQKLICGYAKVDISEIIIAVISDIRAVEFDIAHLKFKIEVTCESYKKFATCKNDEVRIVFTAKETEFLNGEKSLFGYSTTAWTIDHARYNFNARCIAQEIEHLIQFRTKISAEHIYDIKTIMSIKTLAVADKIVAMCIANAKKLGSAEPIR